MKSKNKMCLIIIALVILTIVISIFLISKFKVFKANKKAEENIKIGDNEILTNLEELAKSDIQESDIIGTLTIPDILLDSVPIKEGTKLEIIKDAIGHFTETSIYGGNVGLAAHNTGENCAFFKDLNKLKLGSEIYYETLYGTRKYVVKLIKVIDETDWSYLEGTLDNRITLITCINGQNNKRLCVQGVEFVDNN